LDAAEDDCSVLVIDDDEKVCLALSRHVEQMGCRARHATSGARGLELVAEQAPDLVLLDLKMPGMSGPEFLEKLRKDHPALPVVIVTGYPDSDLMHQATRYPPLMLLPKPVKRGHIEGTVRMVLGERMATLRTAWGLTSEG
jgi:DNA-binding NtrC family response regulator